MQNFVNEYNQMFSDSLGVADLFEYDTILKQFTLKNGYLR